jgi:glycosyltransferase involved in cell wall biosynthesis
MNSSKVSIVIPNYNQMHYLRSSIQSVLNQTYKNFEIVIIDDGSTDDSKSVISGFGDRVRCIYQENKGLAGARNTGIHAARGELIGLLDADDEWMPSYLERMVSFANANPEAAVYYCRAQAMDANGDPLPQIFGGPPVPPDQLYHTLLRANFIIPSTILMIKSAITQAGLFDPDLRSLEDWDLWLRLLPTHRIIGIDDILVKYRIHGSSLSTNVSGMQNAIRLVVEKHFGLDDGKPEEWSADKHRAYGGMYRYQCLTNIQRMGNWEASIQHFIKGINVDPSLSKDLDFFYELALGMQPAGYRGSCFHIDFYSNTQKIKNLIDEIFCNSPLSNNYELSRNTRGTANFAIGLLAYNLCYRTLCRRYLFMALFYRPDLLRNKALIGDLIKSLFNLIFIHKVRRILKRKAFQEHEK